MVVKICQVQAGRFSLKGSENGWILSMEKLEESLNIVFE
jgi:hypothetical protein